MGDTDAIFARYKIIISPNMKKQIKPRYNISPSQMVPVIRQNEKKELIMEMMRWGLIPSWAKDPVIGNKMINARAESVAEKPSFKYSLKNHRCLIPASGFYEWENTDEGKIPHYVYIKEEPVSSFAGLYDIWNDSENREIKTFTIITTKANKILEPIHNRMPVILDKKQEDIWLNNDIQDTNILAKLLIPYPSKKMTEYIISRIVNSTLNEGGNLIHPLNKKVK